MSYRMINVFCAAAGNLEEERQAFYRAVGRINEAEGMKAGALFTPLSIVPGVVDKQRVQDAVDYNIRLCTYYILALDDSWGPASKNFEADYRLALRCQDDPAMPMREVVVFLRESRERPVEPAVAGLRQSLAEGGGGRRYMEFSDAADFEAQVSGLLSGWLGVAPPEGAGPEAAEDGEEFVRRLIMETVAEELGVAALPAEMLRTLLEIQYRARMKGLHDNFPDAVQEILRVNGEAAGWVVIARREEEIRLVDIAIARAHRGKGIGGARIRELLSEADAARKVVRLSVGVLNPAVRLYTRLGFRQTGGDTFRYSMERLPSV